MAAKHKDKGCEAAQCSPLNQAPDSQASAESRRRVFRIVAAGIAAGMTTRLSLAGEDGQILVGDRLALHTTEENPVALRAAEIKPGKVVLAFPFDPASKKIRNESRLSKILLLRADEAQLKAETRPRSAGGILAFSGVCTHAGCDVNSWMAKTSRLLCYCHGSQFDPYDSGTVAAGPAPRSLPWLAIKLEGEELVVAGPLSASAGAPA